MRKARIKVFLKVAGKLWGGQVTHLSDPPSLVTPLCFICFVLNSYWYQRKFKLKFSLIGTQWPLMVNKKRDRSKLEQNSALSRHKAATRFFNRPTINGLFILRFFQTTLCCFPMKVCLIFKFKTAVYCPININIHN